MSEPKYAMSRDLWVAAMAIVLLDIALILTAALPDRWTAARIKSLERRITALEQKK